MAEATNWGLSSQGRCGHWASRDEFSEGNGSIFGASLVAQLVKNLPAMQETPVQFLGREVPLEKGQATHSSVLGLPWWLRWQRICLQCGRPGLDPWVGKIPLRRAWQPTPAFKPGESHGQKNLVGYIQSVGLQRVGHEWAAKHSTAVFTLQDTFRVRGERKEWGFSGYCEYNS